MIVFYVIALIVLIFFSIVLILIFLNNREQKSFEIKILNFTLFNGILEYHMIKAYDIIYKDKILIFSLEATKMNDLEFNVVSKEFVLLVFKFLGPVLKEEYIEFYGNEETLIFNIIDYFNRRIENDEIREQAKQNLFNDEENKLF